MRQAGIIAAAGIVALSSMVERLSEDHDNAGMLANAIANMDIGFDANTVETNILVIDTTSIGIPAAQITARLAEQGIKISQFGDYKIRMVTHHGITGSDINYTAKVLASAVKG
jgi:threonine aldolase